MNAAMIVYAIFAAVVILIVVIVLIVSGATSIANRLKRRKTQSETPADYPDRRERS
jgi:predicted PurR-regulated permease PerM